MYYTGRNMALAHKGMRIDEGDWTAFLIHAASTMEALGVPAQERGEISAFVAGLKGEIVEAQEDVQDFASREATG
jgi:hemoglobin